MADINELFKTFNDNITLTNSKSDGLRTGRDALREKIKNGLKIMINCNQIFVGRVLLQ